MRHALPLEWRPGQGRAHLSLVEVYGHARVSITGCAVQRKGALLHGLLTHASCHGLVRPQILGTQQYEEVEHHIGNHQRPHAHPHPPACRLAVSNVPKMFVPRHEHLNLMYDLRVPDAHGLRRRESCSYRGAAAADRRNPGLCTATCR